MVASLGMHLVGKEQKSCFFPTIFLIVVRISPPNVQYLFRHLFCTLWRMFFSLDFDKSIKNMTSESRYVLSFFDNFFRSAATPTVLKFLKMPQTKRGFIQQINEL